MKRTEPEMLDIFLSSDKEILINRIDQLTPTTVPQWGKMHVAQMLAHCNIVPFDVVFDTERPRPNIVMRLLIRWLAKPSAVGEKPYAKNSITGPDFKVTGEKDFIAEKSRLIEQIHKTHALGVDYFLDKESPFGRLTKKEWTALFFYHLDHHLRQFGV